MAECFAYLLESERIRRATCKARAEVGHDLFDYVGMLYTSKCKHMRNGKLSPFELPALIM